MSEKDAFSLFELFLMYKDPKVKLNQADVEFLTRSLMLIEKLKNYRKTPGIIINKAEENKLFDTLLSKIDFKLFRKG